MHRNWKLSCFWAVAILMIVYFDSSFAASQIINGGFETVESTTDPLPTTFGDWAGDVTSIVTAQDGIVPVEGIRMLHFINTDRRGPHAEGVWSEVFQLVDLSAFSGAIDSGTAKASVSYRVNRISGDSQTDTKFGIWMAAYAGSPASFPSQQHHTELASVIVRFFSDSDVATWELVSGELDLPENADFLAIGIYAEENVYNDAVTPELDGHYGDDVVVDIMAPVPVTSMTWSRIKVLYSE